MRSIPCEWPKHRFADALKPITIPLYCHNIVLNIDNSNYIDSIWSKLLLIAHIYFTSPREKREWCLKSQFKRGLPSLTSTNMLPPSPLEIRRSSSRYVVSSHDSELRSGMENFNGGWLEIVLAKDEAVSCTEVSRPLNGERSIFCPRNSTFSGSSIESVSCGVPITPSSNLICKTHSNW